MGGDKQKQSAKKKIENLKGKTGPKYLVEQNSGKRGIDLFSGSKGKPVVSGLTKNVKQTLVYGKK